MKRVLLAMLLAAALCAGCAAGGQAPAPKPSTAPEPESPSSVSEPAPEPESAPEPAPEEPSSSEEPVEPASEPEPEPSSAPEEPSSQPESEKDPNETQENPDTSLIVEDPAKVQAQKQASDRAAAVQEELRASMPKDIYGRIFAWLDWDEEVEPAAAKVVLEITVSDEKAVDDFLANWQGTKWDVVKKEPAVCSRAAAEALVKKIEDYGYDFGPGTTSQVYEWAGLVFVRVDHWEDDYVVVPFPAEIAKIAEEEGLQEALYYEDSYKGNGGRAEKVFNTNPDPDPNVNPDT